MVPSTSHFRRVEHLGENLAHVSLFFASVLQCAFLQLESAVLLQTATADSLIIIDELGT